MNKFNEAMNGLEPQYVLEANPCKIKRRKTLVKVVILCISCIAITMASFKLNNKFQSNQCVVYASQLGSDKEVMLGSKFSNVGYYSVTQSSFPALGLRIEEKIEYDRMEASLIGGGKILKYNVTEDDIWQVEDWGNKLKYNKNEIIFWIPTDSENSNTCINVSFYLNDTIVDNVDIQIKGNEFGYIAMIK